MRDDPSWTNQHAEIRFGVPTRVSGWKVVNEGARKVTEVKLLASEDGLFFQEKYTVGGRGGRAGGGRGDSLSVFGKGDFGWVV